MNAPAALLVIRWLIWDTFRQAMASRIFGVMLGISGLTILFCLTTSLHGLPRKPVDEPPERISPRQLDHRTPEDLRDSGVDIIQGEMSFLLGATRVPFVKYREDAVRWIQLILASFIADTLGLLLALIWTAAFLPTFLDPSAVTVLLAKPVPRWSLLMGKVIGVLVFVAFQALVFVGGTWIALALRTGVWDPTYLWCIPVLVLHFAVFFSFSCMLAVWTRSTIVAVVGSLLFWAVCWGMNYGRHSVLALPLPRGEATTVARAATAVGLAAPGRLPAAVGAISATHSDGWKAASGPVAPGASFALELGYWILPKPADVGIVLGKLLGAENHVAQLPEFTAVERAGQLHLELSVLASLLFAAVMLAIACHEFLQADY